MIKYAENFKLSRQPVQRHPKNGNERGRNSHGYGSKISTDFVLQFNNNARKYRVYAICWSNVASHYVVVKGEKLFVRDCL